MPVTSIENFIKRKRTAKKTLAKELSFSTKKPLLALFLDSEIPTEEEEKITTLLAGTENLDVEVVILADSNLDVFSPPHVIVLPYSRANRKKLLEAADISLGFPFNDVEEMLINGVIPISCDRPEVKNYDPNKETGNCFIYREENPWAIFASLVRAVETFRFPYDWKHIVRQGLDTIGE